MTAAAPPAAAPERGGGLLRVDPLVKVVVALALPVVLLGVAPSARAAAVVLVGAGVLLPFGARDRASAARLGRLAALLAPALGLLAAGQLVAGATAATVGTNVLRLAAVALPSAALLTATPPVDLADALVTRLRVSPRFAYGALAALSLLPGLARDWRQLGRAQRARGRSAAAGPVTAARVAGGRLYALLVLAVRRGVRLAAALQARGLRPGPRTSARPHRRTRADAAVAAAALLLLGAAVWVHFVRP